MAKKKRKEERKNERKKESEKLLWPRVSLLVFLLDDVQHGRFKRFPCSVRGVSVGFILIFLLLPPSSSQQGQRGSGAES